MIRFSVITNSQVGLGIKIQLGSVILRTNYWLEADVFRINVHRSRSLLDRACYLDKSQKSTVDIDASVLVSGAVLFKF